MAGGQGENNFLAFPSPSPENGQTSPRCNQPFPFDVPWSPPGAEIIISKIVAWFLQFLGFGSKKKNQNKPVPIICPPCKGTGKLWSYEERPCPKCKASGKLPGWFLNYPSCRPCLGTGSEDGGYFHDCLECLGFGRRVPPEKLKEFLQFATQ